MFSKSTFYDFILCDTIKKYFDKISHDFLNRTRMISILSMHDRALRSPLNFTIPWIIRECQIGKPRSAVLETEGRAILGTFQARLRESIRSSNSDPTLLRPPQKANSLRFVQRTDKIDTSLRNDRYTVSPPSSFYFFL